jgi:hypothetical protein
MKNKYSSNFQKMLRVGRITYKDGKRVIPSYEGFTSIVVLTKCSEYGSLGPYCLTDDRGRVMECIWQFAKIYKVVPYREEQYCKYPPNNYLVWKHDRETHINGNLSIQELRDLSAEELIPLVNAKYYKWRTKGMNNKYHVRYPVGFRERSNCICALWPDKKQETFEKLDYIQSRKKIYLPVYCSMTRKEKQFIELKERYELGENLLIIEVDGPHEESIEYYKEKYNVSDDFIQKDTMLVTEQNIKIMLNDPVHPFGHCYCIAMQITGKHKKWNI